MLPIEIKSTGTLVDEMITAEFKIDAGNEAAKDRRHALGNAVQGRTLSLVKDMPRYREFMKLIEELRVVLKECWDAQQAVHGTPIVNYSGEMSEDELMGNIIAVAKAGRKAQETNAQRNIIIRRIDDVLQEASNSQLEKTYG